jgi:signal transduction histidine kinase
MIDVVDWNDVDQHRATRVSDRLPAAPIEPDEQTVGLLSAVSVLRGVVLAWALAVVLIDLTGSTPIRAGLALGMLGVLAAWTFVFAGLVRHRSLAVGRWWTAAVDLTLGGSIAAADHLVYPGTHPQTFASVWPMSAAVVVGICHGARLGALAGALIGVAGATGTALLRDGGLAGELTASVGTIVLLTVAGALAGLLTSRMRSTELARARAAAREEVARTLHDGVLQTLAAVQRRSDDPELVRLSREQELDLRRFITTDAEITRGAMVDLLDPLQIALADCERRTGIRVELAVIDTPRAVSLDVVDAVRGAVSESIVNADKHGGAATAVVCVDVEGRELVVSVNDDGAGFDPTTTPEGVGISRSIRGRLAELGGDVQVRSSPGQGCEVVLRCVSDSIHAR